MKHLNLFSLLVAGLLMGCNNYAADNVYVVDGIYDDAPIVVGDAPQYVAQNNGRDLVLETNDKIVHIAGTPDVQYAYHVWIGDKDTTTAAPDVIVERGEIFMKNSDAE